MPLYKRSNSAVWWADINEPGRDRLRQSTGETDRRAAQKRHDELAVELRRQPANLAGKTWGQAVERWAKAKPRSESELRSLIKFGQGFSDRALGAVTPEAIDEALAFCKTAGTYMRYRAMLAAVLNMSGAKLKLFTRKDRKTKPRIWLTPLQWAALLAELPPHMKPMAEFALATGMRQANVLGLTWARVDLQRGVVWVEAEDMKADKALSVPLSGNAQAVLERQQGQHPEFVFTYRNKPIKEIKTAFIAACVRAGVGKIDANGRYSGFTWHGLRHTWATWHKQANTPDSVLQELGGWTDPRMVANYAHHAPGYLASFAGNAEQFQQHRKESP